MKKSAFIIISCLIFSTPAIATDYDIGASAERAVQYMEETITPVVQHGAEWGATAGLAFSGLTAFVTVIKKFLE